MRIFIPKKLIRTVECPIHAAVRSSLLQLSGVGCANAGAMGRRLSTIHSCQRWPSQLRRRDFLAGAFPFRFHREQ